MVFVDTVPHVATKPGLAPFILSMQYGGGWKERSALTGVLNSGVCSEMVMIWCQSFLHTR